MGSRYTLNNSADVARTRGGEDLPLELRPRRYGEVSRMIQELPLHGLLQLSQARKDPNRASRRIGESIESTDLIYPPVVAQLDGQGLADYVAFVNRVWGSSHDIAEHQGDERGLFYVVIAGHTRVTEMLALENQRLIGRQAIGYDEAGLQQALTECVVHDSPDSHTMIGLQLDENLHRDVPEEQEAVAIVEAFYYGIESGRWASPEEFVMATDRFSKRVMDKALAFARLPEVYRKVIISGGLRYELGIAVRELADHYQKYTLNKYFAGADLDDLTDAQQVEITEQVDRFISREIVYIEGKGKSFTKAKYRMRIAAQLDSLPLEQAEEDSPQGVLALSGLTPEGAEQDWHMAKMRSRLELKKAIERLVNRTSEAAVDSIINHGTVLMTESGVVDASRLEAFKHEVANTMVVMGDSISDGASLERSSTLQNGLNLHRAAYPDRYDAAGRLIPLGDGAARRARRDELEAAAERA